jgi:hypothetical protein
MRHIHTISGKDSLASAIVMLRDEPDLPMEYVWNDTGWELPEVHEWIVKVETFLKKPIIRCGDDLTEIVEEQGLLPSPKRRFCTRLAKIKPTRELFGTQEHILYLGLRADEDDRIAGMVPSKYEQYRFPLKEKGMVFDDVWRLVSEANMLPPMFFWQWMYDRVHELGGRRPEGMPDWEWFPLFAGRSRPNCDRCFYQRLYEWIWLAETHPDRFEAACDMEESHQDKSEFRWKSRKVKGKTIPVELRSLLERAYRIKEVRARSIVRFLNDRNAPRLFPIVVDNPFGAVSCGLFCGK